MQFLIRNLSKVYKLGVLPGTFNPPTRAHLSLAEAALRFGLNEVVLVLPRTLPHKEFEGADLSQRMQMLRAAVEGQPGISAAVSDGGLFSEIAAECREAYGPGVELTFVCGRDAAERVMGWNYSSANAVNEMMEQFGLLVACRNGHYDIPAAFRRRVHCLTLPDEFNTVAASDVRRRIGEGLPWVRFVPDAVAELAKRIYRPAE